MINTYPVRDALDLFLVSVPGCPAATARRALIQSAQEFCDATGVHQERDSLPASDGIMVYEFDAPSRDLMIMRLDDLSHGGMAIRNVLELDSPVGDGLISATMILGPGAQAKRLWAPLIDQYGEALAAGALKRLLLQQGTDYHNPQQAAYEAGLFSDFIHNARVSIQQPRTVKPRGKKWAC